MGKHNLAMEGKQMKDMDAQNQNDANEGKEDQQGNRNL